MVCVFSSKISIEGSQKLKGAEEVTDPHHGRWGFAVSQSSQQNHSTGCKGENPGALTTDTSCPGSQAPETQRQRQSRWQTARQAVTTAQQILSVASRSCCFCETLGWEMQRNSKETGKGQNGTRAPTITLCFLQGCINIYRRSCTVAGRGVWMRVYSCLAIRLLSTGTCPEAARPRGKSRKSLSTPRPAVSSTWNGAGKQTEATTPEADVVSKL